MNFINY